MTGTEPTVKQVGHFTMTEKPGGRVQVDCGHPGCGQGIEAGETFGPIPGEALIAEFAKLHAHQPKKRRRR